MRRSYTHAGAWCSSSLLQHERALRFDSGRRAMRAGGAEMRVQTRRRRTSCQRPRHYTPPPVRARAGLCTMLYPPSQRLVSARPSPRRIAVIAAMSDQRHRRVARAELGERITAVLPPSVTSVSPRRTSCSGCGPATASLCHQTAGDARRRCRRVPRGGSTWGSSVVAPRTARRRVATVRFRTYSLPHATC